MSELPKLKQYPSGFLGSSTVAQTAATDMNEISFSMLLSRKDTDNVPKATSSIEINTIWNDVLSNKDDINTFEYKERIIRYALTAFGTTTVSEWLSVQSANPEFTKDHHRFIDETIQFVAEGKKRIITANNWIVLLNSNKVEHSTLKYSEVQQRWLLSNNTDLAFSDANNVNKTFKSFITDWVCQDKGIDDLTSTLFVLFGMR